MGRKRTLNGFTLLELLMTLLVGGTFLGIAAPSFSEFVPVRPKPAPTTFNGMRILRYS